MDRGRGMKTNMLQTSLLAYDNLIVGGKCSKQQAKILGALEYEKNYSLQEIVKITGITINAVSGRVNDLKKLGMLELSVTRHCQVTHSTIHSVCLAYPK